LLNTITAIGIATNNNAAVSNVVYTFDQTTNFTAIFVYMAYAIVIGGGI
jgi:hypothetical protein